jgi:hypothetical protein
VDSITWYALGVMLTGIGLALSYRAYQRRGVVAGVRGVAWSLIPLALALTKTLKLAGEITDDIGRWATNLVFSPTVWLGICVAGVSVVLFGISGFLRGRGVEPPSKKPSGSAPAVTKSGRTPAVADDDMADIEAILRKHGIS